MTDLLRVKWIGPVVAESLKAAGINDAAGVAEAGIERLIEITGAGRPRVSAMHASALEVAAKAAPTGANTRTPQPATPKKADDNSGKERKSRNGAKKAKKSLAKKDNASAKKATKAAKKAAKKDKAAAKKDEKRARKNATKKKAAKKDEKSARKNATKKKTRKKK